MSDDNHEDHGHDVHFESTDAGSSTTFPAQAGSIRKGAHIVIKGRPCKVIEVSTSKTGKHGHAKCHFVATDIFTGKKMEELVPSSHNCDAPFVVRDEYTLTDISDDDYLCLMTEDGNTREDLQLPDATDDDKKVSDEIRAAFEDGDKTIALIVMKSMNEEKVISMKTLAD